MDGFSLQDDVKNDQLKDIFFNGELLVDETFSNIRERLTNYRKNVKV